MKLLGLILGLVWIITLTGCSGGKSQQKNETSSRDAQRLAETSGMELCQNGEQQTVTLYKDRQVSFGKNCEGRPFTRTCQQIATSHGLVWAYASWESIAQAQQSPYLYLDCEELPPRHCPDFGLQHDEKKIKRYYTQETSSPGHPCPDPKTTEMRCFDGKITYSPPLPEKFYNSCDDGKERQGCDVEGKHYPHHALVKQLLRYARPVGGPGLTCEEGRGHLNYYCIDGEVQEDIYTSYIYPSCQDLKSTFLVRKRITHPWEGTLDLGVGTPQLYACGNHVFIDTSTSYPSKHVDSKSVDDNKSVTTHELYYFRPIYSPSDYGTENLSVFGRATDSFNRKIPIPNVLPAAIFSKQDDFQRKQFANFTCIDQRYLVFSIIYQNKLENKDPAAFSYAEHIVILDSVNPDNPPTVITPAVTETSKIRAYPHSFTDDLPATYLAPSMGNPDLTTNTFKWVKHEISGEKIYILSYGQKVTLSSSTTKPLLHQIMSFTTKDGKITTSLVGQPEDRALASYNASRVDYLTSGSDLENHYAIGIYGIQDDNRQYYNSDYFSLYACWSDSSILKNSFTSKPWGFPLFLMKKTPVASTETSADAANATQEKGENVDAQNPPISPENSAVVAEQVAPPPTPTPDPLALTENDKSDLARFLARSNGHLELLNVNDQLLLLVMPANGMVHSPQALTYFVLKLTLMPRSDYQGIQIDQAQKLESYAPPTNVKTEDLPGWFRLSLAFTGFPNVSFIMPNTEEIIVYQRSFFSSDDPAKYHPDDDEFFFYYSKDFPKSVTTFKAPRGYRLGNIHPMGAIANFYRADVVTDLFKFNPAAHGSKAFWSWQGLTLVSLRDQKFYQLPQEKTAQGKNLISRIISQPVIIGDTVYFIGEISTDDNFWDSENIQIFKIPLQDFTKGEILTDLKI